MNNPSSEPNTQVSSNDVSRETRLTLIGILLGLFLAALDQTIVSTALPKIIADLNGAELYAWVTTAYLLASTVSAPIFGRLTELFSRKAILLVAIAIFLLGSALAGLSQNMPELILFRGVQGIGGGALFALALTTIAVLFPPRERGRVGGLFGAIFGVSSAVGPWLGGLLTDHFSWHWVFYINMPVGAVALWFILRYMPRLSPEHREGFDYLGAALLVAWTVPLMLAFSWGGSTYPWLSAQILGLLGVSVLALVLWVWSQNRAQHPLFDLSILRVRSFSLASAATFFYGPAFLGAVAFLPLYLQVVKGVSASASGVTVLPLTLGVVLGATGSGVLSGRLGRFKPLLLLGTGWLLAIFLTLHFLIKVDTPLWLAVLFFFLLGLGLGPAQSLLQIAAQNNVPPQRLGSATAFTQLMRQIGSTVGIALMGTLLAKSLSAETCKVFPDDAACRPGALVQRSNEAGVGLNLDEQFARLEAQIVAALKGDTQAYSALLQDAQVPTQVKEGLIEGGIPAQFQRLEGQVVAALRGNAQAYEALMRDPNLPAEFKSKLTRGGIPAQFEQMEGLMVSALEGDIKAYEALMRDPNLPAEFKSKLTRGGISAQFEQMERLMVSALEGDVAAYNQLINDPQIPADLKARLVKGGIPAQFAQLEKLLLAALNGDARAYQAVQQNPQIPPAFKSQIPQGGLAAQVETQLQATARLLEAAWQGDESAQQALRQNPRLDPRLRSLLDNPPPVEARPGVLAQVQAQAPQLVEAALQQATAQIKAGLRQVQAQALAQAIAGVRVGLAQARAKTQAAAIAAVRENLQKAQAQALEQAVQATHENLVKAERQALEEVPRKVVAQLEETKHKLQEALNNGITKAEQEIFLYAALFVLISLIFILPLPNEELRGDWGARA
ncbi:MAG: DHA2 family efflux MFS transporter permease subunit [Meiothermus ruber]|jgi:EmrB/QacA subfamily drug resistance transporter|uniref:DHA2 family efflux MFS transporter permease subunit n=1 Tax=Meiothermus ruber TaxID=277 RepID=UPI00391C4BEB